MQNLQGMKVTKVCEARDKIEAEMMLDILGQHDIPAFRRAVGLGGIMDIYSGNSICGEGIYADESDVQAARELLRNIIQGMEDEFEKSEKSDEEESEE